MDRFVKVPNCVEDADTTITATKIYEILPKRNGLQFFSDREIHCFCLLSRILLELWLPLPLADD